MSDELSPKRRAFAREYVLDHNATAAAVRAGYSERSATSQASQLLDMPAVKAEIDRLHADAAQVQDVNRPLNYPISGLA
jgi:phage terminase small subunit